MNNIYIREFIEKLEHTEIWKETEEKCESYDAGVRLLVDTFTAHKKKIPSFSLSATAEVLRLPVI